MYCKTHTLSFPLETPCPKSDIYLKQKGYNQSKKVIISKDVVISLNQKGYNQTQIAKELNISQARVSKILKATKGEKKERFHNFSLKFEAIVPYETISLKEITLKHSKYKNYTDKDFHVQIFKNAVIIRYLKDIVGMKVISSEQEAINKIKDFIKEWNIYKIDFKGYKITSGHNAFTQNEIAKDMIKKGQDIKYNDPIDNKLRTSIDLSHNSIEFEHQHTQHYNSDSKKWEKIIDDVATNKYDDLSTTKYKIDTILQVQMDYAENIKKHLLVQDETLLTLKEIRNAYKESSGNISNIPTSNLPKTSTTTFFYAQCEKCNHKGKSTTKDRTRYWCPKCKHVTRLI
jgi:transcriptional regulator with XRE-family HTH domain